MNWYVIGIGVVMLIGCFLTINTWSTNSFDYDLAFILLIGGIITIAFGTGFLDMETIKNFVAINGTTE